MKTIKIGRAQDDDIIIDDPTVTRCHTVITQDDNGNYSITNYGENGTFVNGKDIGRKESVTLNPGDVVRIGNSTLPWQKYFEEKNNNIPKFKKCENGHFFSTDLENCPFCNGKTIDWSFQDKFQECSNGHFYTKSSAQCPYCPNDANTNLESNTHYKRKVCSNYHDYDDYLEKCPYCEEEKVVNNITEPRTMCWGQITGRTGSGVLITIDCYKNLYWSNTIVSYTITVIDYKLREETRSEYKIQEIPIFANTKIQYGKTLLTGKEFIKMCDTIIDNQLVLVGI
jgi:RNA polymerase subunit RPABC4/transcription elongation factor Spt4